MSVAGRGGRQDRSGADPAGATPPTHGGDGDVYEVPPPTMTVRLMAAALGLEAVVVFFAALTAIGLSDGTGPSRTTLLVGGAVLAVVFVLGAAVVRRPGGAAIGWALQAVLVALGFVVSAMFAVGALFTLMWLWFLRLGHRVDADRRRWAADLAAGGTGRD